MSFLTSIRHRAAARRRRIVLPETSDSRTINAAAKLQRDGLVDPVLLGAEKDIRPAIAAVGGDAAHIEIIDPAQDARRGHFLDLLVELRSHRWLAPRDAAEALKDPLIYAALLVRTGVVDGCVAGAARSTADVLRAALWCVGPAEGIRTISSSFYMVVPPFRGTESEVLTFTDAGVVPEPTAEQLADIAVAAVHARTAIVGDEARVAFLSYSTKGSAEGASVSRVREALEIFRQRLPEVPADGELQADAALIEAIGSRKAPGSAVAGSANVLVFPGLDAANIAYKLVQRLAKADAIGPILQGLAKPLSDLSRGASIEDIVNVACITALL